MKTKVLITMISVIFLFLHGQANDISFVANTRTLKGTDLSRNLELTGRVIPNTELRIKAPFGVSVSAVHVIDGEWVTDGKKLLTYGRKSLNGLLAEKENELKKWEKILWQREHWAQREKKAEDAAKKEIGNLKKEISRIGQLLKDPVVRSTGEGRVLRICPVNKKVEAGEDLAVLTDDYVMKIPVPRGEGSHFFKGMRLQLNFPEKRIWRSGKVGTEDGRMMIFISNPDLKISAGMKADFTVKVKRKGVLIITNREFRKDADGDTYVYVSENGRGVKRTVTLAEQKGGGYLVLSGLKAGEVLISPIVDTEAEEFTISRRIRGVPDAVAAAKKRKKKPGVSKPAFSLGKKMEYVVSAGLSFSKPDFLVEKNSGINDSVSQYGSYYGLTSTATGEFKENLNGIPVRITVNYKLSDGLYLKFGGEYSSMSNSSARAFNVEWPSINEKIDYDLKNTVTNITPFVGIEKRFSSFGIYGVLALNLTSFNHISSISLSDGSYSMDSVEEIKANGTGIGILLGAKYMFRIKDKFGIFLKLEYAIQSVGSLSGDKTVEVTDSINGSTEVTESGSIYTYDIDPYGEGGFGWWDLHASAPSGSDVSNVSELSLKLSRIRLLLGFSF